MGQVRLSPIFPHLGRKHVRFYPLLCFPVDKLFFVKSLPY